AVEKYLLKRQLIVLRVVLLFDPHKNGFPGVLAQERDDGIEHIAKVNLLEDHAMVNGEYVLNVAAADIENADSRFELIGERQGLSLSSVSPVECHGVVSARKRQAAQQSIVFQGRHPSRIGSLYPFIM